ncbi:copper homeostasis protein CutC [Zunongwangia sp. H14]|uniref:copper homeostasis protein CutC n=1 Tax=Zunongwangia sp. H14 TaxID=3240792 RepID=UPI00356A8D05
MSISTNYLKEACVETFQQAMNAENLGANRIELCARLDLEGITPSKELIKQCMDRLNIPLRIMIRPRAGDFVYSEEEMEKMKSSIRFCKDLGVDGVVFGILNKDKTLNLDAISKLVNFALPLKVIIHKAIDETPHILTAVKELCQIGGITSILTSGGKLRALEGIPVLKNMIEISRNQVEIIPAGNITSENVEDIHLQLGAKVYHGKLIVGKLE